MGPFKVRPPRHEKSRRPNVAQNAAGETPNADAGPDGDKPFAKRDKRDFNRPQGKPNAPRPVRPRFDKPKDKSKEAHWERPVAKPKEKPMDPNSPFAVLSALKASMVGDREK